MALFYQPGRYWGRVCTNRMGETKNGKPQFILTFQIVGKINPEDPTGDLVSCKNDYERSVYRTITDKTIDWLMEDLQKLGGFPGSSFRQLDDREPDGISYKGVEAEFYCEHKTDESNGKLRESWGVASERAETKPLEQKKYRDLDNLFGKNLKAMAKGKTPTPASTQSEKPSAKRQQIEQTKAEFDQKTEDFLNSELQGEAAATGDDIPF